MPEASSLELRLVTIATFPEPMEASIARSALESAGIACWINGESANTLIPIAFTAQLQVGASDEAEAREILQQMETSPVSLESVTEAEEASEAAATEI